ncbi:hypothetical protein CkaCkLH20_09710 [Colletotrichum karsti]|uniref:Uncharacterized protein n=1 Tax=Colletotrichum karsti TaxID=1095194 RepID=A0A9P6HX46_9PEZI|nr:uncharacterized protein CkaCkLH20_09710 [Colletotrichum karsti]KAF9872847.1 hypothetical protein CkaCkLH20_09710 [Colletotrichum karsti]
MKFNILAAVTALIAAAEACKCGGNIDATRACCRNVGGVPTSNDCPANTISERLSGFASCCRGFGVRSDCRCPVGCAKQELEAARKKEGLTPLNDSEILAALSNYDG